MAKKLLTGEDLDRKVKELGVDPTGDQILGTNANVRHPRASDFELQRRRHLTFFAVDGASAFTLPSHSVARPTIMPTSELIATHENPYSR